jgi:hypothetical protein
MAMNPSDLAAEDRRPYAATANIVGVLQRARTRNLPEVIDDEFFRIVEVPDVVFGRVREGLRFLGMIDADGRPTDTLRAISAATDEEYRELLASAIRRAYEDDFTRIDPGQDTSSRIANAFRRYQPRSQTQRMVMLFLGLCREAGISVLDAPRDRQMQPREPRRPGRPSMPRRQETKAPTASTAPSVSSLPAGLVGLLQQIPRDGVSWTSATRQHFLNAFTAVLDFTIPVDDNPALGDDDDDA